MTRASEHDLGYLFLPPPVAGALGHPELDIFLREKPSGRHFDPEEAHIPVFSPESGVEALTVYHPWAGNLTHKVYPGSLQLEDRLGKTVHGFTFGGDLVISPEPDCTVCQITSSAPILSRGFEECVEDLLTEEVEILLAKARAHWTGDLADYERQLSAIPPFALYAVVISMLARHLRRIAAAGSQISPELNHTIQRELHATGEHPLSPLLAQQANHLLDYEP